MLEAFFHQRPVFQTLAYMKNKNIISYVRGKVEYSVLVKLMLIIDQKTSADTNMFLITTHVVTLNDAWNAIMQHSALPKMHQNDSFSN